MKKNYIDILNNTLAKHDSATNRKSLDAQIAGWDADSG